MHANRYKDIFTVDESSDLPIWVQLRNRMAYLIRTGFFAEGEQIPSVRSLAAEARINYNTVTKAYRDLELEKLIVNVRGRGMYVQQGAAGRGERSTTAIDARLEDCVDQYRALGMTFDEITLHIQSTIDGMRVTDTASVVERSEHRDAE